MDKVLAASCHTVTDETLLLKWISLSESRHQQIPHPLVKFQPGGETFAVLVLEPKEPGFPQPNSLYYLHR